MGSVLVHASLVQHLSGWLILIVVPLLSLFVARWVYRDANRRGSEWAWQWAVLTAVTLLAPPVGLGVLFVYFVFCTERVAGK